MTINFKGVELEIQFNCSRESSELCSVKAGDTEIMDLLSSDDIYRIELDYSGSAYEDYLQGEADFAYECMRDER